MESFDGDSKKTISSNFSIRCKIVHVPGNSRNAVPFVTGNFQKFKPEFFIKSKALLVVWFEPKDYTHESLTKAMTIFTVNSFHLKYDVRKAISGYRVVSAQNCLAFTLNYIVKRRSNHE